MISLNETLDLEMFDFIVIQKCFFFVFSLKGSFTT